MSEPTVSQLGQVTSSDYTRPAVVLLNDAEVVVLDYVDTDNVEVWQDGVISRHPGTTAVTEVTDPERWQVAVRRTLLSLNHQRVQAIQELEDGRAQHAATLEQIRSYAIDKHRAGAFGREELNEFLDHVGLKRYDPHVRLSFAITGHYETATTDAQAARTLATDALTITGTDGICQLDENSISWQVEVLDVIALTTEKAGARLRVDYRITGTALVTSNDLGHAQGEAQSGLKPDLSRVPGLIPDAGSHQVEVEAERVE